MEEVGQVGVVMRRTKEASASTFGGRATRGQAAVEDASARYKVEAVSRAVLVLDAFRQGPATQTAAALAQRTGLGAAAVEAILATLERRRLVQPDPETPGAYRLGLGWLRLADVKRRQIDLRRVSLPVLEKMRDAVNETVSLGIRIGDRRVNIEYAESRHEVRRIVQPGFHVALHVGAGGRVMLSGLADDEVEAYLAAIPLTQGEKSKLIHAVKAARRDGYSIVDGEVTTDTAAIAAPVWNHMGEIVAVVAISLPNERLSAQMRARCVREVAGGAAEISRTLGYDAAKRS